VIDQVAAVVPTAIRRSGHRDEGRSLRSSVARRVTTWVKIQGPSGGSDESSLRSRAGLQSINGNGTRET
jgi:hypothetical protein